MWPTRLVGGQSLRRALQVNASVERAIRLVMRYDPNIAPNAPEWCDLDEGQRISAIEEHHKRAGIRSGNATVHAGIDAAVETQLAEGMPVTVETLDRLLAEGMGRPDAIHLLASAISEEMFAMLKEQRLFDVDLYGKRLRGLTAGTQGGGNGT